LRGVSSRLERTAAFRACIAAQGKKVRGEVLEIDAQQGEDALARALADFRDRAGAKGRCAVVAGNSVVTLRVAAAVARLQWTFGQELGFVGFDDPEWAPLIRPGLSTVAQPTDAIGQRAARCLLERIGGLQGAVRENLLPGTLIVRGSSLGV